MGKDANDDRTGVLDFPQVAVPESAPPKAQRLKCEDNGDGPEDDLEGVAEGVAEAKSCRGELDQEAVETSPQTMQYKKR
jgi:hypothetical protein